MLIQNLLVKRSLDDNPNTKFNQQRGWKVSFRLLTLFCLKILVIIFLCLFNRSRFEESKIVLDSSNVGGRLLQVTNT